MWIGNLMLIILNLPMIGVWVKLLKVPYRYLFPAILTFCCIGVYSVQNTTFDVPDRRLRRDRLPSSSCAASRRRCCSASCWDR